MFLLAICFFAMQVIYASFDTMATDNETPRLPEECGGVYYDDDTSKLPPAATDPNDIKKIVGSLDQKFQCDPKTGLHKFEWDLYCKDKTWLSINQSWMDESGNWGSRNRYVSNLPGLAEVAKNHFQQCEMDGIELNTRRNKTSGQEKGPDFAHWSERLFSDELMAPTSNPELRLSIITLTAMNAYNWYQVDTSQAEPLTVSKPSDLSCELKDQSCHQIIKQARETETHKSITPYCDDRIDLGNPTAANRCFKDQQTRLHCYTAMKTDQCPVLKIDGVGKTIDDDYDDERCDIATKTSSRFKVVRGESVGEKSICVTFTREVYRQRERIQSLCMWHECRLETQSVVITRTPLYNESVQDCPMECTAGLHCRNALPNYRCFILLILMQAGFRFWSFIENSNKLVNFSQSPECSNGFEDDYFTILCPDYQQLCVPTTTVTTTTTETTPSETIPKEMGDGSSTMTPSGSVLPTLQSLYVPLVLQSVACTLCLSDNFL